MGGEIGKLHDQFTSLFQALPLGTSAEETTAVWHIILNFSNSCDFGRIID
jgi:hypothetical protein